MAASFLVAIAGGALARAALPASKRWLFPVIDHTYKASLRILHLPPTLIPPAVPRKAMPAVAPRGSASTPNQATGAAALSQVAVPERGVFAIPGKADHRSPSGNNDA
jgi:hypothetical protein